MVSPEKRHNREELILLKKNKKSKMESISQNRDCSQEYVLMPWEDQTQIMVLKDDCFEGVTDVCSRWELIQKQLHTSTQISNVDDLINVIKSYNIGFEKDGRQVQSSWKCLVLRQYFLQLDEYEKNKFFQESGVLSTIRNLSLQLRELVPRLRLLKTGCSSSLRLHQLQIASLLAGAFLCTFPKGKADCPSINFNTLYEGSSNSIFSYYIEKIKCIMHYFKRIHTKQPTGNLSFHRLCIPDHKFPRWDKTSAGLCSLEVETEGRIEDQDGFLQMDFANRYVGGGVLGRGCVQEEIRFIICPELIAARLFTESLGDNESLFIVGAERYCQYTGYSNTFRFAGDYQDSTPFDENRQRKTYLIVLDALYFHHSSDQYRESKILRELKKAYVGFKPIDENNVLPLATGNWGCGSFGGDPQLKIILQLMASSQAQRDMLYLTFGNPVLKKDIDELYQVLKEKAVNVGMLYRIIRLYNKERRKNQTVFDFVRESINKPERRMSSGKRNLPSNSRQSISSSFETELEDKMSSLEKATNLKQKRQSKKPANDKNYPELDFGFESTQIQSSFTSDDNSITKKYSYSCEETFAGFASDNQNLVDIIWYENEVGVSTKRKCEEQTPPTKESDKMEVLMNSPDLFSDEEEEMDVTPQRQERHVPVSTAEDVDMLESEMSQFSEETLKDKTKEKSVAREETPKPQPKKLVQSKITDSFFKK